MPWLGPVCVANELMLCSGKALLVTRKDATEEATRNKRHFFVRWPDRGTEVLYANNSSNSKNKGSPPHVYAIVIYLEFCGIEIISIPQKSQ